MKVDQLLEILLTSDNDVWRDDAAEDLATSHWQNEESQQALITAMNSGKLDESLLRTCAEALADIWVNLGVVNEKYYFQLDSFSKSIIDYYLAQTDIQSPKDI